jgi:hypothetical protein
MKRKQRNRRSVRDTPEFKDLIKELRKQVPDDKSKLREMLDEVIKEDIPKPDEK